MRLRLCSAICLGIIQSAALGAQFNMTPWVLIFEPQNKVISQMVSYSFQGVNHDPRNREQGPQVNDEDNAPVPVEINISAREINLDGSIAYPNSQGADNFVVYPSQFILYPGDTKKIQVQWVGTALPEKEMAYGFISTQIPLELNKEKTKPKSAVGVVTVVSRYEGIIVLRLKGAKPDVVVDTSYAGMDSTGKTLTFILNNRGNGLQSIKTMNLAVLPLDNGGKIKFGEPFLVKDVKQLVATQSLFPGYRRKISIPWPTGLAYGPVKVTVEFPDGKK